MPAHSYDCPRCAAPLDFTAVEGRRQLACQECGGLAATVAMLRQTSSKESFRFFWAATLSSTRPGHLPCPGCGGPMQHVDVEFDAHTVGLDRCRPCQFVWFDPDERERVLGEAADQRRVAEEAESARIARLPVAARAQLAGLAARQRVEAAERESIRGAIELASLPVRARPRSTDINPAGWMVDILL
jgi:Zn-finger nucleic acid-binding protein